MKKMLPKSTPTTCHVQNFVVPFSYPVYFTNGLFKVDNPTLDTVCGPCANGQPHRIMLYIDAGVVAATPKLLPAIRRRLHHSKQNIQLVAPPEILPGGEQAKNGWQRVQHIMTQLGNHHLCRHSYVLAIGGGSLLDMVGFAASLVHRGLRLIRVPTTVLAQNDAGVGVKNGMNEHGVKNFVGTFAPPHAVLNDFDFLHTLDDVHWRGGIAEAFKVAIIKDAAFFDFLARQAHHLRRRDTGAMEQLVRHCALLHLDHIRAGGDPFERGNSRPLDFGHWSAHKLESISQYTLGHGQAVSIGIAIDTVYAADHGLITIHERDRIIKALRQAGLPVWSDLLLAAQQGQPPEILKGLDDFREHLGGSLTITLPKGIGHQVEVHEMEVTALLKALRWLKRHTGK